SACAIATQSRSPNRSTPPSANDSIAHLARLACRSLDLVFRTGVGRTSAAKLARSASVTPDPGDAEGSAAALPNRRILHRRDPLWRQRLDRGAPPFGRGGCKEEWLHRGRRLADAAAWG